MIGGSALEVAATVSFSMTLKSRFVYQLTPARAIRQACTTPQ
jgi:hypothetical protein